MRLLLSSLLVLLALAGCAPKLDMGARARGAEAYPGFRRASAMAAQAFQDVRVCDAADRACRRLPAWAIDPQGRLIFVHATLSRPAGEGPFDLRIAAVAASEVHFNGVLVGRNGRPGPSAAAEVPGPYGASFRLPEALWRPGGNALDIRMSGFHSPLRLIRPVYLSIGDHGAPTAAQRLRPRLAYAACGALLAGLVYFAALWLARRSRFSLLLAAMSGVAVLQAIASAWREILPYDYPLHPVRLVVMLALAAGFAVLLAAYMAERFWPRRRWSLVVGASALAGLSAVFAPGFDAKTAGALLAGALVAGAAAAVGARRRLAGARRSSLYLLLYVGGLLLTPSGFLDTGFFLIAALLMMVLMVGAVARQWRQDSAREDALLRAAQDADRLAVSTARGLEMVLLEDIQAILGADDYAELRLVGGRSLLHAATLERLQAGLPPQFIRVHRSAIANLTHAARLSRAGGRWRIEMADGVSVPVSRARLVHVREVLAADALSESPVKRAQA